MRYVLSRILTTARLSLAAAVLLLPVGCGGPAPSVHESPVLAAPTELLLERIISGTMQGLLLSRPTSLAVSDRGAVYVLDSGNRRVVWLSGDLIPLRDYAGHGDLANRFGDPRSLAVDADRNLWISDFLQRRLIRTNDRLEVTGEFEFRDDSATVSLGRPESIAVTDFGDIWVVDADNQRIVVLNAIGEFGQTVGEFGQPGGQLEYPAKMLCSADDRIRVCDRGNRRVVVYDDEGGVVRDFGAHVLVDPVAVSLDREGRAWVLDGKSGKIDCFDRDGHHLSTVGPTVSGADQPLLEPSDLAFMPDGRLLITDTGHNRVLVCRPASAATVAP